MLNEHPDYATFEQQLLIGLIDIQFIIHGWKMLAAWQPELTLLKYLILVPHIASI